MTYRLVDQLVDSLSIPARSIRDVKRSHVVVVHLQSKTGFFFEITFIPAAVVSSVGSVSGAWSTAQGTPILQERCSHIVVFEFLQHKQARQAFHFSDGAFINLKSHSVSNGRRIKANKLTVGSTLSRAKVGT